MAAKIFDRAQDFRIDNFQVFELEAQAAAGAIYDSAECCDAPKCHPDTRVAVQDDLYSWIVDGEPDQPKKIKWVTGPAGTGKTAIMGSLSERCEAGGVLAATFFFASWSASIGRRRKTALVTTLAHQLARYDPDLREEISKAIDANSDIFNKRLHTQMEVLVLGPLQKIAHHRDRPSLRGAIIIDGVDECEAEQYHDTTATGSKFESLLARTNDQDQLEILQVLQKASLDPSFPFRIIIASRPERVFREFFDPETSPAPFAQKLDLHEEYNADADITLFLEAQFNRLRRRHGLLSSWPPPGTIQTLVKNASGQFIYAATVIRYLDKGQREPPKALLEAILKMNATRKATSNPLKQLDALYSHILESSPDPPLSIRWIRTIEWFCAGTFVSIRTMCVASTINLLLQTDQESNEAEHLLGNLHSLIQVPPPRDQATTRYKFYHRSLIDFIKDDERCGKLHFAWDDFLVFIWDRFIRACARGCNATQLSFPDTFLQFLARLPIDSVMWGGAYSKILPAPASADWWVSLAITRNEDRSLWKLFECVHYSPKSLLSPFLYFTLCMARNFDRAHDFHIDNFQVFSGNPWANPLDRLKAEIAAGAIHDSRERCDAPKCHPDTRVAVQDDLYSWIVDGDEEPDRPKKIKWVTGPAGTGKTAVMGSLSERCKSGGVLAATFFFASWSASIGRRRKTALVATIAHQLARYHPDLRDEISKAVDANSDVFDKNLHTQMEVLVLGPLQEIARHPDRPVLRGAIIIDGLDECEAEQYHDTTISNARGKLARKDADDQIEILQVLQAASSDSSFPFRIIIASRPERVFREFFDPENTPITFAHKLDLHEEYNADADITLFLEAQFNRLRRRYQLPSSWPPLGVIQTLVRNASGQFIYAATVIRVLDSGRREPPKVLLEAILKMETTRTTASNPLEQLDALYSHILESSPEPPLSIRWIQTISWYSTHEDNSILNLSVASNINLLLQTDPDGNEAEHLLGNLHSLIKIPPSDQVPARYDFYHKSLIDFLEDSHRCGKLYVKWADIQTFVWDRFIRASAMQI
ncbi:hypothetical protein H1R20_g8423, partial [Candolleomyces eurysporus]